MRTRFAVLALALLPVLLAPAARGADLLIDGQTDVAALQGDTVNWTLTGTPGAPAWVIIDVAPGPASVLGHLMDVAVTPQTLVVFLDVIPAGGTLSFPLGIPTEEAFAGMVLYVVAIVADGAFPEDHDYSNGVALRMVDREEQLAGNPLAGYPHFAHVRSIHVGAPVAVGIDPVLHADLVGLTADVYVVASRTRAEWLADATLVDVSGDGPESHTIVAGGVADNTIVVDPGTLSGNAFPDFGVGYDVVVDVDQDGVFDADDLIDGFDQHEAGFYVVPDPTLPGPLGVTEITYTGGSFLGQNTFYPSAIAGMGALPLVIISHGNGHNYQWYDHIGNHLASHGFVVMSHENNTGPGVSSAATTTLTNTDWFFGNLDIINGGVLDGHIDGSRITWIGHSRGGEGITIAYDRLVDGQTLPQNYALAGIRLLSSIAPTAFQNSVTSNPHAVDYHLWVGGADADVTGCPTSNAAQSFHLHDRAEERRMSISLHGVGHGDFHNSTGSVATGPCLVGKSNTHAIMRGYLLPLVAHHILGSRAAEDFLWRQWETFRPALAPASGCVVVDLQYRQGTIDGKFVIDDFQTNASPGLSSSGGTVSGTVVAVTEGALDDPDSNFTNDGEAFNGFTYGQASDTTRGLVFEYTDDAEAVWEVVPEAQVATRFRWLSFRVCQLTRHALTTAALGDLVFTVELEDGSGTTSAIRIDTQGGGVEEPYQRTSCGIGTGWGNEFETIRLRLADFARDGSGLDLTDLAAVRLRFGPSWGSPQGRLGLDDLELTHD